MLSRQALRTASQPMRLTAAYATHAPSASVTPPTNPPAPSGSYDPELDPQLADMAYPKLYTESRQLRNPRGWWDSQERIQFGEPVPEQDDVQSMWAPDVHKVKPSSAFTQLAVVFATVFGFGYLVCATSPSSPALPRGYAEGDASLEAIGARKLSDNTVDE
ncbi:hypothetical protein OIV83_003663 [Microbotryomycetes sp. JL201]|nr:hypothetical protein OIV83_003663 [Microbotryomycetes sp. JL201]